MSFDNYKKHIRPLLESEQEREDFKEHLHKPLKKSVNVIQSRLSSKDFVHYVKNKGRKLTATSFTELSSSFYIDREDLNIALGSTYLHQAWYFYTQEVAASIPANFVDVVPNALVLDMCAAPGGKTIQLADKMIAQYPEAIGCIRSNDINAKRLQALQANINRSGLYNTVVSKINGYSFGKALPETFDSILLDAPCSGEGTSFRSSESLKFRNPQAIKTIANTQYQLLISALKACKVWWSIVYSTCTINEQENEHNIKKLLKEYGYCCELETITLTNKSPGIATKRWLNDNEAQKCMRCRPHKQHTWWFFVAKIRKTKSIQTVHGKTETFSTDAITTNKRLQTTIKTLLQEQWGIQLTEREIAVETTQHIFLTSQKAIETLQKAVIEKIGIAIYKKTNDWLKPLHGLACTVWKRAKYNIISLTAEQAQRYTQKENINIEELWSQQQVLQEGKYYLLSVDQLMLSIGKVTQGIIKNKFVGL